MHQLASSRRLARYRAIALTASILRRHGGHLSRCQCEPPGSRLPQPTHRRSFGTRHRGGRARPGTSAHFDIPRPKKARSHATGNRALAARVVPSLMPAARPTAMQLLTGAGPRLSKAIRSSVAFASFLQ